MAILLTARTGLAASVLENSSKQSDAKPRNYTVRTVRSYPHDTNAYTQGLFFHNGELYESTGLHGKSSFRKVDLKSGKVLDRIDFGRKYFMEGSVILGDEMFLLTWQNNIAYVYDAATLKFKQAYSYPKEGWGLTTDGKLLIASDGSDRLYFLDRQFRLQRSVNVSLNGRPIRALNELEWIDGRIWANIYTTDIIVIINPADGNVEGIVNCAGLLSDKLRTGDTDVLNGIAILDDRIFITGKNWPLLFEVQLIEK